MTGSERRFGDIEQFSPGMVFDSRWELMRAGIHRQLQAGIAWTREGADSVILSGGYKDDVDLGSEIFYTGEGGNLNGRQVANQALVRGNLALAKTCQNGRPLRVVKKTTDGFLYDGIYRVAGFWSARGRSKFKIWRFHLIRIEPEPNEVALSVGIAEETPGYDTIDSNDTVERRVSIIQRLIRNTEVAASVKHLYKSKCQVCRETIKTIAGDYAEAAHIRPLGTPHNGPDDQSNVLCLCPNHHVMFDLGGFVIRDDFTLISPATGEVLGTLYLHTDHLINLDHVQYHRALFTDDVVVPFEPGQHRFPNHEEEALQFWPG